MNSAPVRPTDARPADRIPAVCPESHSLQVDPASHGTSHMRNWVCGHLRRWGMERLTADLQLIATELATNAVRHGLPPVRATLSLSLRTESVRVAVTDAGPSFDPEPVIASWEHSAGDACHGRGLMLVAALSTAWGVDRLDLGQRVWAELAP
ncbi:ATP-binding protein [Streptomyces parvus]|uniref:ATP-binding protein n=1 Tax=Streptomyces parvus TaxID=66428 RepID=UPI00341E940E